MAVAKILLQRNYQLMMCNESRPAANTPRRQQMGAVSRRIRVPCRAGLAGRGREVRKAGSAGNLAGRAVVAGRAESRAGAAELAWWARSVRAGLSTLLEKRTWGMSCWWNFLQYCTVYTVLWNLVLSASSHTTHTSIVNTATAVFFYSHSLPLRYCRT